MIYAGDVYNDSPTSANKFGDGVAPNASLGWYRNLGDYMPFGTLAYHRVQGVKTDDKNELVVILGLNHDGAGYRALRVTDDPGGSVFVSLDIKPHPGQGTARHLIEQVHNGLAPSLASFVAQHCNHEDVLLSVGGDTRGGLLGVIADSPGDIEAAKAATTPRVQTVGDSPGHGGSRASLRRRLPATLRGGSRSDQPTRPSAPTSKPLPPALARILIRDARDSGMVMRWRPGYSKKGLSGERFQFYSRAKTFAQFEAMLKETYLSGITGTWRPKASEKDLRWDTQRGIVTFHHADTPPASAPDGAARAVGASDDAEAVDSFEGADDDDSAGGDNPDVNSSATDEDTSESSSSAESIDDSDPPAQSRRSSPARFGRHWGRRSTLRAAKAFVRKHLSPDDMKLLEEGLKARSAYVDVPDVIMMAAKVRHEGVRVPENLRQALESPQRDQWLEALKKEYGGLLSRGVFDEVDRSAVPAGTKVVPTRMLFAIKSDGTFKVRIVVRGDLMTEGEHYVETKSSMVSIEAIRMVVSLAAGNDMRLFSTDFSQAFLNADIDVPNLYCSLPELPPEMLGGEFGKGKAGGKVAHVRKAWYGLKSSPLLWERHLQRFMTEELGARLLINDRNVFEWEWQGHRMYGAVHVDDMLFAVSSLEIRDEFMRRIRARFEVTGGEDEATEFCGMEITRDWDARTISLKQTAFARQMMDTYGVWDCNPEETPFKVGAPPLDPHQGDVSDVETFDYMMFLGDLAWYSRTNPGLSYAVHHLAQFMQNPGNAHVKAARRVLRYIRGNLDAGLTYHGSAAVLEQSYDHRNKLIATFDGTFPHDGRRSTTGVAVMLNGAAVAWKTRKQTTVSLTSTEAEVKAMSPGIEMLRSLTDLWGELHHQVHGSVRTMVDSQGGKAQVDHGMDTKRCASYKRAHCYAENAVGSSLLWLDLIPGYHNPADVLTKQPKAAAEFKAKTGVLCGSAPHLYESAAVLKILSTT